MEPIETPRPDESLRSSTGLHCQRLPNAALVALLADLALVPTLLMRSSTQRRTLGVALALGGAAASLIALSETRERDDADALQVGEPEQQSSDSDEVEPTRSRRTVLARINDDPT